MNKYLLSGLHRTLGIDRTNAIDHILRIKSVELLGPPPSLFDGIVFIHIPKAAGSSIRSLGVGTAPGHKPYRFYSKWAQIYRKELQAFAVVRHPYTRFLSAFYYLQNGGKTAMDKRWARRKRLTEYNPESFAIERLSDGDILSWMHFLPQTHFVTGNDGSVAVTDILQYERLSKSWPDFAKRVGLDARLPIRNRVGRSDSDRLSERTKTAIQDAYRCDFETFGFLE